MSTSIDTGTWQALQVVLSLELACPVSLILTG